MQYTERYEIEIGDAISFSCEGLCKAVDNFKPDKNGKFSGYAAFWIMQIFRRNMITKRPDICCSMNIIEKYIYLHKYKKYLNVSEEITGYDLNISEIKEIFNCSVSNAQKIAELLIPAESLNKLIKYDSIELEEHFEFFNFYDYYKSSDAASPFFQTSSKERQNNIRFILNKIKPQWRYILIFRYGLGFMISDMEKNFKNMSEKLFNESNMEIADDVVRKQISSCSCKDVLSVQDLLVARTISSEENSLEDIGKFYGLTRERIRQIESKALRKLLLLSIKYGFIESDALDKKNLSKRKKKFLRS